MAMGHYPLQEIARLSANIAQEVNRLNQIVEEAAGPETMAPSEPVPREPQSGPIIISTTAHIARQLYKERRRRDQIFGDALFGEPVWDMLLDIFIADETGETVTVTSATQASCIPATTALRYINAMIESGMVIKRDDPRDKRRSTLNLSADAREKLIFYLEGLSRNPGSLPPPTA